MKRFLPINLFVFLLTTTVSTCFTQLVTIGTEDGANAGNTYPAPFAGYYKTHKAQYLYSVEELLASGMTAGIIQELHWQVLSLPVTPLTCSNLSISLLSTTIPELSDIAWESGATLVWGPNDFTPELGENVFTLNTPFNWDGISGIIVEVCNGSTDADINANAVIAWNGPLDFNASHTHADNSTEAICDFAGETTLVSDPGGAAYRPLTSFMLSPLTCDEIADGYLIDASATTICASAAIHLNVYPTENPSVTYHWYQSLDGETWDIINEEYNKEIILTPATSTWYRNSTTCPYNDTVNYSSPILITTNSGTDCACTPVTELGTAAGDYISNISFGDIDNTTEQLESPYYFKYTENTTEVYTGNNYLLSITVGSRASQNTIAAWIDFNADGNFTTDEKIGEVADLLANESTVLNCFIPLNATSGETILRIREVYNATEIDACASYTYGESEDYIITLLPTPEPAAAFTFSGDPTVYFMDASEGFISQWEWNFDDGIISTEQNPLHTFLTNGTFNVCLIATNAISSDTVCQTLEITNNTAAIANFIYAGDPVTSFINVSTGSPSTFIWDFGDGIIVEEMNPVHHFSENGDYEVCLTVMNAFSENTSCQTITITNNNPLSAAFNFSGDPEVVFTDLSAGEIINRSWDFGDGNFSTEQNPTHTFSTNGTYTVCLIIAGISGSDTACNSVEITGNPSPVALFSYSGDPVVVFNDLSVHAPDEWLWSFGDGAIATEQNPVHTYATNGDFEVCLTASNENGGNIYCATISINGNMLTPVANFEFSGDPVVTFSDISTNNPTSWLWNFDDGFTSSEQNPTHHFIENGTYHVCLTATNAGGTNLFCNDIVITNNYTTPVAAFSFSGDPEVTFTSMSANSPDAWYWDFAGEGTSTDENPTFTFTVNGSYNVCLTVSNPAGSDMVCESVIIDSYNEPVADFTYTGEPMVEFFDASAGAPTSWHWEFGDGTFALIQNPSHLFLENGIYNVCLTAQNIHGLNTICKDVIIDSYTSPVADFSFTGDPSVIFTDNTLNNPDSWYWIFGDGGISTEQNPTHVFIENDIYNVCLFVTNDIGTDVICQDVIIEGYTISPEAAFSMSGDPAVEFLDESLHSPTTWFWDFGDGTTADMQNPTHLYASNGTYEACLTAGNMVGSDIACQIVIIDTYMPPSAEFVYSGDPIVSFTDISTYSPHTWFWDFNDGAFSTEQNPVHNFTTNGTYNVCLSATGAGGTNTWCTEITIATNGIAPAVDFDYAADKNTILFTDNSDGAPTEWLWDFGDGTYSAIQNPVHTYATPTTYYVCLTASNPYGENTVCKTINFLEVQDAAITGIQVYPNPSFSYIQLQLEAIPQKISIVNMEGKYCDVTESALSNNVVYIPTAHLPAGTYTVVVHYFNSIQTAPFVKN